MVQTPVNVFWFRRDLRLHDNCGLYKALQAGLPVVPLFIFDRDILDELVDKDDKRVSFIYQALEEMQAVAVKHKSTLDVRYGKPGDIFNQLLKDYPIANVFTNHDYEPYAISRDRELGAVLAAKGIGFNTFKDQVIFERDEVTKDDGSGYTMYAPYFKKWRKMLQIEHVQPYPSEKNLQNLLPGSPKPFPTLAEMGFTKNAFIPAIEHADKSIIESYHQTRDVPSVRGTTRSGVQLRFGTISVRQTVATAEKFNAKFLNELIWREFFMQLLWHQPRLIKEECKPGYDGIRWRNKAEEFERWCIGQTGYPIVDAGMRELNETGFMHNRVRMIAGSFLVKDLLIDWRWGEAYFARKLLDYELASNNGNWQWVAGCGCDAAPYFRVFNPNLQTEKFDPKKEYIKRWVPEVDKPGYPKPMVDHNEAKARCLTAYKAALHKVKSPELF